LLDILIRRADNPTLRIQMSGESLVKTSVAGDWQTDMLRDSLADHLAPIGTRTFRLDYLDPADARAVYGDRIDIQPHPDKMMLVSLQLNDGGWLNFAVPINVTSHFWSMRFWLSMAVMILAVVIFAAIVVHHLIKPLRLFVRAANRFGLDVEAPALPETGPREVREATRAFNDMQHRIRRMIDSRTHMLAAISHDLRTPITLLRLRAEFIEDEDERGKTMATLDEMESMIAATLAFARQDAETEESRRVDLGALIESICNDMGDVGHAVAFDPPETLTLECRPTALRRALSNLIENAVKYGSGARVRLAEKPNSIEVLIEDAGPGIPPEELERVFEPFYRMETSRNRMTGGVGLGLSVARTVVHAHGGEIHLSNRPEGGLRVSIDLPR